MGVVFVIVYGIVFPHWLCNLNGILMLSPLLIPEVTLTRALCVNLPCLHYIGGCLLSVLYKFFFRFFSFLLLPHTLFESLKRACFKWRSGKTAPFYVVYIYTHGQRKFFTIPYYIWIEPYQQQQQQHASSTHNLGLIWWLQTQLLNFFVWQTVRKKHFELFNPDLSPKMCLFWRVCCLSTLLTVH